MPRRNEPLETRRLREFHELGKQIVTVYKTSQPPAGGKRRRGVAQTFYRRLGLKRDQVDKARQFAAMYSDKEVEALCELGVGSGGRPITKCHVIRLLAVRSKRQRFKLAKQIVRERWTVQQLGAEITKKGKHSQGGRPPQRPATAEEALGQIQRMAQHWCRWTEMLSDRDHAGGIGIGDLPKRIATSISKVSIAMKSLRAAASAARSIRSS